MAFRARSFRLKMMTLSQSPLGGRVRFSNLNFRGQPAAIAGPTAKSSCRWSIGKIEAPHSGACIRVTELGSQALKKRNLGTTSDQHYTL